MGLPLSAQLGAASLRRWHPAAQRCRRLPLNVVISFPLRIPRHPRIWQLKAADAHYLTVCVALRTVSQVLYRTELGSSLAEGFWLGVSQAAVTEDLTGWLTHLRFPAVTPGRKPCPRASPRDCSGHGSWCSPGGASQERGQETARRKLRVFSGLAVQ